MRIARRIESISPSATMAMKLKADELRREGHDVLSFAVGEPDFPTPDNVVEAAKRAMDEGQTKYTAASGMPELKDAIRLATERDLGLEYRPSEIIVSNGAKHSLYNIAMALVNPGDEVIIFSPYWVTYPDQIALCEGRPVVVHTRAEDGFQPDLSAVRAAITDYTVAILVNSPCNPTGAVYGRETMEGLVQIALEHDLTLISDEIYKHIIFDGREHISPAQLGPEAKAHTLVVDGVAKSYSMPGWRIGWVLGPERIVKAMGELQGQCTSNPNTIAQWAAVEALTGPQQSVAQMCEQFQQRRDFVMEQLSGVPEITCPTPAGAFYVFPDVSAHYQRMVPDAPPGQRSDALALKLLSEHHISLVAGSSFGADECIRLSFAASMEELEKGLRRFAAAFA
ncbi:MAG: pyridoxal phosphate-dependent aminotransferase [Armatimonadota bacterium]